MCVCVCVCERERERERERSKRERAGERRFFGAWVVNGSNGVGAYGSRPSARVYTHTLYGQHGGGDILLLQALRMVLAARKTSTWGWDLGFRV